MSYCQIALIIDFLYIRTGLFTPDMAFEIIVKEQIEKLRYPSMTIVDQVIEELNNVVARCAQKVNIKFLNYCKQFIFQNYSKTYNAIALKLKLLYSSYNLIKLPPSTKPVVNNTKSPMNYAYFDYKKLKLNSIQLF